MTLGIGSSFASYRIERLVARGGMGEVYAARHTLLDRVDALKLLRVEFADDDIFRERFLREAHLAASVRHPAVVPVYTAGEAAGRLYLVMYYVEGSDLREVLRMRHRLAPRDVSRIIRAVAGALDAAHRRGLVHRDVKPGNILLAGVEPAARTGVTTVTSGSDDPGAVYLTDFGITRLQAAPSSLTQEGAFLGSAGYVAPEQVAGAAIDGRTDLYSLACVAYECLTGSLPFAREGQPAMLSAHLHQTPPPPSAWVRDLPRTVDTVLLRALSKEPGRRHGSCLQFADELNAVLESVDFRSGDARPDHPTVSLVAEPDRPEVSAPVAELAVAGGPLSGTRVQLAAGRHVVGRGEQADVRLSDRFLSRLHVVLDVSADGRVAAADAGSANGSLLDGEPLTGEQELSADAVLEAGTCLLQVLPGPGRRRDAQTSRPKLGPIAAVRGPGRRWGRARPTASELHAARLAEARRRRLLHPDAGTLLQRLSDGHALGDDTAAPGLRLDLRLGFGPVTWTDAGGHPVDGTDLPAVPLTVSLPTARTLVLRGDRDLAEACARWVLLQAVAQNAPEDLAVVVALPTHSPLDWSWVPLLPHAATGGAAPAWSAERRSSQSLLVSALDQGGQEVTRPARRRARLVITDAQLLDAGTRPVARGADGTFVVAIGPTDAPAAADLDATLGRLQLTTPDGTVRTGTPDGITPTVAREAALQLAELAPAVEPTSG